MTQSHKQSIMKCLNEIEKYSKDIPIDGNQKEIMGIKANVDKAQGLMFYFGSNKGQTIDEVV